ncbi:hypothetical protein ACFFRR_005552 [Megaselia abdita]
MVNGLKYNIVQNIITNKYYVCENKRPVNCRRVTLKEIKANSIQFKENPKLVNLFSKDYHTNFRGHIDIEMYSDLINLDTLNSENNNITHKIFDSSKLQTISFDEFLGKT